MEYIETQKDMIHFYDICAITLMNHEIQKFIIIEFTTEMNQEVSIKKGLINDCQSYFDLYNFLCGFTINDLIKLVEKIFFYSNLDIIETYKYVYRTHCDDDILNEKRTYNPGYKLNKLLNILYCAKINI